MSPRVDSRSVFNIAPAHWSLLGVVSRVMRCYVAIVPAGSPSILEFQAHFSLHVYSPSLSCSLSPPFIPRLPLLSPLESLHPYTRDPRRIQPIRS